MPEGMKKCIGSKKDGLPHHLELISSFGTNKSRKDGLNQRCRQCSRILHVTCHRNILNELLNAYGGACECCGSTLKMFLTLQHVLGEGKKDRLSKGANSGGHVFYARLKRLGYPKNEGYVIQCYNCNCGAQRNDGVCPYRGTEH